MPMLEIRLLLPGDKRDDFVSGDESLDQYFRVYAGQNQFRHRIGVNYVAIMEGRVIGYAGVSPAHIEVERLPAALGKRLPGYPLPVLRLARLATDRRVRGQGVGLELLRYVFGLSSHMSRDFGCVGVLVDAKVPAVPFYERYGFTVLSADMGVSKTAPVPMFLSINRIPEA
jgi:GNAT superfamily N-acetyltransferase